MPEPLLRPARADDAELLTAIARRSKAHWGYDADFLDRCRDELTVHPADCAAGDVLVAEQDGSAVGFAHVGGSGAEVELDALFVEPGSIGSGVGRSLFAAARELARDRGAHRLVVDSDPHAEDFYRRMGCRPAGTTPSGSIPGRVLPRLVLDL